MTGNYNKLRAIALRAPFGRASPSTAFGVFAVPALLTISGARP
jgi:hypothetical protein